MALGTDSMVRPASGTAIDDRAFSEYSRIATTDTFAEGSLMSALAPRSRRAHRAPRLAILSVFLHHGMRRLHGRNEASPWDEAFGR